MLNVLNQTGARRPLLQLHLVLLLLRDRMPLLLSAVFQHRHTEVARMPGMVVAAGCGVADSSAAAVCRQGSVEGAPSETQRSYSGLPLLLATLTCCGR